MPTSKIPVLIRSVQLEKNSPAQRRKSDSTDSGDDYLRKRRSFGSPLVANTRSSLSNSKSKDATQIATKIVKVPVASKSTSLKRSSPTSNLNSIVRSTTGSSGTFKMAARSKQAVAVHSKVTVHSTKAVHLKDQPKSEPKKRSKTRLENQPAKDPIKSRPVIQTDDQLKEDESIKDQPAKAEPAKDQPAKEEPTKDEPKDQQQDEHGSQQKLRSSWPLDDLCSLAIFGLLNLKSRFKCRQVCKQWRSLADAIETRELIIHDLIPAHRQYRWFYGEDAVRQCNVFDQFKLSRISSAPFVDSLKRLWIDYAAVNRCTIDVAVLNQFVQLEQLTVNCLRYTEDEVLKLPNLIALDLNDAWTIAKLTVDAPKLKALYANLDTVRVLDRRSLVYVRACSGMNSGNLIDVYPSATQLKSDETVNFNLAVLVRNFPALQICDLEQLNRVLGTQSRTYQELKQTIAVIRTLRRLVEMRWTQFEFRFAGLQLDDPAIDRHLRAYCGLPAETEGRLLPSSSEDST